MKHDYPAQLAARVHERWNAVSDTPSDVVDPPAGGLPDREALELLFSVVYQASLLREEERPVTFRLILAEPTAFPAEAGPPLGLHRLLFTQSRRLGTAELRRLSPAVSYHRALIGVRADGQGEFEIWGIVYSGPQWLHAAQGGRPASSRLPPSSLVVRVTGPGLVAVARGGATLCALHAGRLGGSAMDVFGSRWLANAFMDLRAELTALHIAERSRAPAPWAALDAEVIALVAPQMLKRLVTTILRTRHGGILLLVPSNGAGASAGRHALLRIKYQFCEEEPRRRYRTLIVAKLRALASVARRTPSAADLRREAELFAADEALLELSSLIAALANVDGAVVLTLRFELLGFGCEIGGDLGDVTSVRRALDLEGTRWIEETTETVGTRHRAAYRLCQRLPEAVAIVVSQDGSVRFVANKDGVVTYWDQLVDLPEA
ncbi:Hypothetical protein A7982_12649 [Minicystis rosea]|nr:Hypothetical protein A7982_12649 [Minicystis rosea]